MEVQNENSCCLGWMCLNFFTLQLIACSVTESPKTMNGLNNFFFGLSVHNEILLALVSF